MNATASAAAHQYWAVQWTTESAHGFVHSHNDGKFYRREDAVDYANRYQRDFPHDNRAYEIVEHGAALPEAYWARPKPANWG